MGHPFISSNSTNIMLSRKLLVSWVQIYKDVQNWTKNEWVIHKNHMPIYGQKPYFYYILSLKQGKFNIFAWNLFYVIDRDEIDIYLPIYRWICGKMVICRPKNRQDFTIYLEKVKFWEFCGLQINIVPTIHL